MKGHWLLAAAVFLVLAADNSDDKGGRKPFQGTWTALYGSKDGKPYADELLNTLKISFSGDKIMVHAGDEIQKGTFELGAGKPRGFKEITIRHADGKTKTLRGIYKFDEKGILWLCFGEPGKERPKKFNNEKGGKCEVLKLEREKS
jgi:uncharacterized protein (TIGR03067 family)